MLNTFSLPNGLKVATYCLPGKRSAYLSLSVRCGSLYESPEENGLAHFLEHILAEGIPSLPTSSAISSFIEDRAGRYNLTTRREEVNFWVSLSKDNLTDAIRIARELFFEPLFEQKSIDKEKSVIYSEIRSKMDQSFYKFWSFWKKNRFIGDNPLQMMTVGSIEIVENFTREQIISFWKKYFTVNNCCLTIVGDFNDQEVQKNIETTFGDLKAGPETKAIRLSAKMLTGNQAIFDNQTDIANNTVNLSWGTIGFTSKLRQEYTIENLVRHAIANMASSRLHQKLRSQTGLVYSVEMTSERYAGLGFCEIESKVSNENLVKVSQIILDEVIDVYNNGITTAEFEKLLKFRIDRVMMTLDNPGSITSWIEDELFWQDEVEMPDQYVSRIKNLNREDVKKFLKKYWDLKKVNLLVQGPAPESVSDSLREVLKSTDLC